MRLLPMTNRRFGRRIRTAVRIKLRAGEITPEQAARLVRGSHNHEIVARWRHTLSKPQFNPPWVKKDPKLLTGIDWKRIWEWLMDNWPTILKILLSLLVFLDAPKVSDDCS